MFSTLFQAIGKGSSSLIISVLRQLVLIIPAALILSQFGLMYVWFAFPIAEGDFADFQYFALPARKAYASLTSSLIDGVFARFC